MKDEPFTVICAEFDDEEAVSLVLNNLKILAWGAAGAVVVHKPLAESGRSS